jgi:hypothetical protein
MRCHGLGCRGCRARDTLCDWLGLPWLRRTIHVVPLLGLSVCPEVGHARPTSPVLGKRVCPFCPARARQRGLGRIGFAGRPRWPSALPVHPDVPVYHTAPRNASQPLLPPRANAAGQATSPESGAAACAGADGCWTPERQPTARQMERFLK